MAKAQELHEGWDGTDEFIGAGDLLLLNEDGESTVVVLAGDIVALTTKGTFGETKRVVVPVVTEDGLACLPIGARTYRKLRKVRDSIGKRAVEFVRHGAAGDTGTFYSVQVVDLPDTIAKARAEVKDADVKACVAAVLDILRG